MPQSRKSPVKAAKSAPKKTRAAKAPAFELPGLQGKVSLEKLKGKKVVLYFYPKDDTSGCTKEACGFQKNMGGFKKAGAVVIGVSKDDLDSHKKFAKKYKLNFNLASDQDLKAAKAYGAWVQKSMYGRKYMGLDRSTFLIDENGNLLREWRKVKVPGHAEEVLKTAKAL
ncbi:MAG: peroxiredoxin [Proteobacteria bacterium]|nr:peroxiredoxin [Pseudomonadota bacterium]